MAEFCLDCFNEQWGKNFRPNLVTLSKELCICEGCARMKHVVEKLEPPPWWHGLFKRRTYSQDDVEKIFGKE